MVTWEKHLPNLKIIDVNSSNHLMLLSEPQVYEIIASFCNTLYSEEGISEKFLKSFKRQTLSSSQLESTQSGSPSSLVIEGDPDLSMTGGKISNAQVSGGVLNTTGTENGGGNMDLKSVLPAEILERNADQTVTLYLVLIPWKQVYLHPN